MAIAKLKLIRSIKKIVRSLKKIKIILTVAQKNRYLNSGIKKYYLILIVILKINILIFQKYLS